MHDVPLDVGPYRQMFFDDYVVAECCRVHRHRHQPVKDAANPVLRPERAWERNSATLLGGRQVHFDPTTGRFQMWYRVDLHDFDYEAKEIAHDFMGIGLLQAYAESADGRNWSKPILHQRRVFGNTENNYLGVGRYMLRRANVLCDEHEEDPDRRYKMIYVDMIDARDPLHMTDEDDFALLTAYSHDGVHWRPSSAVPEVSRHHGGSCEHHPNLMGWDERRGQYALYVRRFVDRDPATHYRDNVRAIGLSLSEDFENWSFQGVVLEPDEQDGGDIDFPGLVVWVVEGVYVGLLYCYQHGGDDDGSVQTQLVFSRDGVSWRRCADREWFLPRGPAGAWDQWVAAPTTPVIVGDEIWFYYGGWNVGHSLTGAQRQEIYGKAVNEPFLGQAVGLARLRREGFVSLRANASGGQWTTRLLTVEEPTQLEINARAMGGQITVDVLSAAGQELPERSARHCIPFNGDQQRHTVDWSGGTDVTGGGAEAIRLRFHMEQAELFSFRLTPSDEL